MKKLTETKARLELVKAIHSLNYEELARVYSYLIDDNSVVVTPDGDPYIYSSVYQHGQYILEHRKR